MFHFPRHFFFSFPVLLQLISPRYSAREEADPLLYLGTLSLAAPSMYGGHAGQGTRKGEPEKSPCGAVSPRRLAARPTPQQLVVLSQMSPWTREGRPSYGPPPAHDLPSGWLPARRLTPPRGSFSRSCFGIEDRQLVLGYGGFRGLKNVFIPWARVRASSRLRCRRA